MVLEINREWEQVGFSEYEISGIVEFELPECGGWLDFTATCDFYETGWNYSSVTPPETTQSGLSVEINEIHAFDKDDNEVELSKDNLEFLRQSIYNQLEE